MITKPFSAYPLSDGSFIIWRDDYTYFRSSKEGFQESGEMPHPLEDEFLSMKIDITHGQATLEMSIEDWLNWLATVQV